MTLAVHRGRQIYPGKKPQSWRLPQLETAVLEDAGERWFQVTFGSEIELTGSAADGWTDLSGQYGIRVQRSFDLQTWDHDLIEAPGYPIDNEDGTWTYAARSKYPIESDIKSGHAWLESGGYPNVGDARNNPFTSVILAGEVQDLPNYPYTMPGDAAQLQTDLRAVGWTGATVVATSDTQWRIEIPAISLTERIEFGRVCWPGYLIPDYFGNLTNTRDHAAFSAEWINSNGVSTSNARQFARLAFSHLNPP